MKKAKETEIRAEVENLRSLDKDDLRARWCKTFGKEPPPALTKDLLGRMIAWRIQEKFYAGPRLKPGTVLMREHRGVRHTVTVVLNGFVWQGQTFPSLTTVARAITGTSWNGPRFFGLRIKRDADQTEAGQ